jgi:hypothetical protein
MVSIGSTRGIRSGDPISRLAVLARVVSLLVAMALAALIAMASPGKAFAAKADGSYFVNYGSVVASGTVTLNFYAHVPDSAKDSAFVIFRSDPAGSFGSGGYSKQFERVYRSGSATVTVDGQRVTCYAFVCPVGALEAGNPVRGYLYVNNKQVDRTGTWSEYDRGVVTGVDHSIRDYVESYDASLVGMPGESQKATDVIHKMSNFCYYSQLNSASGNGNDVGRVGGNGTYGRYREMCYYDVLGSADVQRARSRAASLVRPGQGIRSQYYENGNLLRSGYIWYGINVSDGVSCVAQFDVMGYDRLTINGRSPSEMGAKVYDDHGLLTIVTDALNIENVNDGTVTIRVSRTSRMLAGYYVDAWGRRTSPYYQNVTEWVELTGSVFDYVKKSIDDHTIPYSNDVAVSALVQYYDAMMAYIGRG